MSVHQLIKSIYNDLRPVQKKIADYFLAIHFNSINTPIDEMAPQIGVSVASVSRFCKNLGFDSFQHFKISLSRDSKHETNLVLPIFQKDDDPDLIIRKAFSQAITNLQATEGTVQFDLIKRVVEKIRTSKAIYFYGLGGSGGIGYIGKLLFSHIGYTALSVNDQYEMIVSAGHAKKGYTMIGLSHTGCTRTVIEALRLSKANEAFTVGITNYRKSPLAQLVNITLLTGCHERKVHFAQSNSMVAQLTLIHAMYILTASRSNKPVINRVNEIENNVDRNLRVNKKSSRNYRIKRNTNGKSS